MTSPYPHALLTQCVFFGVFLDRQSRNALLRALPPPSRLSTAHGDHVTALRIGAPGAPEFTRALGDIIGLRAELRVFAHARGRRTAAALVRWPGGGEAADVLSGAAALFIRPPAGAAEDATDELYEGSEAPPPCSGPSSVLRESVAETVGDSGSEHEGADADDSSAHVRRVLARELGSSNSLSHNALPHVTIATADGVSAVTSNEMLRQAITHRAVERAELTVRGRVGVAVLASGGGGGRRVILNQRDWSAFCRPFET